MTPSKAKALAAVHAARRGKPVNPAPPEALRLIKWALRKRRGANGTRAKDGPSIKAAADLVGVSDRTLRRWLAGTDRPSAQYHEALAAAVPQITH